MIQISYHLKTTTILLLKIIQNNYFILSYYFLTYDKYELLMITNLYHMKNNHKYRHILSFIIMIMIIKDNKR
jgi:hypothetical protein